MPDSAIRSVNKWTSKTSGMKGFTFKNQNMEPFIFENGDMDENLMEGESTEKVTYPEISVEVPGVDWEVFIN